MTAIYKYLAMGGAVLALIVVAFFYGQHVANTVNALAQSRAVAAAQAKADALSKDNAKLATRATNAESVARAAVAAAAAQPAKVRYVYVHEKPKPNQPTPAPVAITGPVFVSAGAVSLYDDSLGIPGLYGPGEPDDTTSAIPSLVTISQYQLTTVSNNAACYTYTVRLSALQAKVQDWIKAGVVVIQ